MRPIRRSQVALATALIGLLLSASPALACGGLIGPNGAVNLLRTTTFAGYHAGVEHYVTSFEFAGGGGAFGSITPLPGIPSSVERGGDWTLQRLIQETSPVRADSFASEALAAGGDVEILLETTIDALDITVLKGGGDEVGAWAAAQGFRLPPDSPEVLDFYASRSPIFLAAAFDADAAAERGQAVGDGTPVHVTIPTPDPWVPLRILGLGKNGAERVEADVYLLTDRQPAMLPQPTGDGLFLDHSAAATQSLLDDLRSDAGMEWIPEAGWLSKVRIDSAAGGLRYDLAIDASGQGTPSRLAAGLDLPEVPQAPTDDPSFRALLLVALMLIASGVGLVAMPLPTSRARG
ncbi:MAG: DUF2330 domain-containing protein, partial [Chloroflexota bacterium]|nr:DUF2330 domain-containing protein [Chloroflexota bacterium]